MSEAARISKRLDEFIANGRFKDVLKTIKEKKAVLSQWQMVRYSALVHWKMGDEDKALQYAQQMININKAHAESYILMIKVFHKRKEMDKVKKALEQGLKNVNAKDPERKKLKDIKTKLMPKPVDVAPSNDENVPPPSNDTVVIDVKHVQQPLFGNLPFELLVMIFHRFNRQELNRLRLVCKQFKEFIESNSFFWSIQKWVNIKAKTVDVVTKHISFARDQLKELHLGGNGKAVATLLGTSLSRLWFRRLEKLTLNEVYDLPSTLSFRITRQAGSTLSHLLLSECDITDEMCQNILKSCPKLIKLDLSKCKALTKNAFDVEIEFQSVLTSLNLADTLLDHDILPLIQKKLPAIQDLDVSGISGSASMSEALSQLQLTRMHWRRSRILSAESDAIMNVFDRMFVPEARLFQISLSDSPWVSADICRGLGRLTKLKSLDLSVCPLIDDECMAALSTCTALIDLNLGGCFRITDTGFVNFVQQCRKLQRLVVNSLTLSNVSIECICESLDDLSILDLSRIKAITSLSIKSLMNKKNARQLVHLDLRGCEKLDMDVIRMFQTRNKHTKVLINFNY